MTTPKDVIIYHIVGPLASVAPTQFGVELVANDVTGYIMWGGKDSSGTITRWLALDKNARVNNLETLGTFKSETMTFKDLSESPTPAVQTQGWDPDENAPFYWGSTDDVRNIPGKTVMIPLAYNDTGATISRGAPCRVFGADTGRPSIELVGTENYVVGDIIAFPIRDIPTATAGDCLWVGALNNFNTSAFSAWGGMYLSATPGVLATSGDIYVGRCLSVSSDTGRALFVGAGFGGDTSQFYNKIGDDANSIALEKVTTATASLPSMQSFIDNYAGRGWVAGGEVTANSGNPTTQIDISAGVVFLSDEATAGGTKAFADFEEVLAVDVVEGVTNYVYVTITGGVAVAGVTADPSTILYAENATIINLIFPDGDEIHITDYERGFQCINTLITRKAFEMAQGKGYLFAEWAQGALLGTTGTRYMTLTAGVFWAGLNRKANTEWDTSGTDTVNAFYRDGSGGHTKVSGVTQIDNTYYDDGTGTLHALTTNQWTNRWMYIDFNTDHLVMVYGQSQYVSLSLAQAETRPSDVPAYVSNFCVFLGRYTVQQGSNTVYTESAFAGSLGLGPVNSHTELSNLNADAEIQHMTSVEKLYVNGIKRNRTVVLTSGTMATSDDVMKINLEAISANCDVLVGASVLALEGKSLQINRIGADTPYKIRVHQSAVGAIPAYTIFGDEDRINKFEISNGALIGDGFYQ